MTSSMLRARNCRARSMARGYWLDCTPTIPTRPAPAAAMSCAMRSGRIPMLVSSTLFEGSGVIRGFFCCRICLEGLCGQVDDTFYMNRKLHYHYNFRSEGRRFANSSQVPSGICRQSLPEGLAIIAAWRAASTASRQGRWHDCLWSICIHSPRFSSVRSGGSPRRSLSKPTPHLGELIVRFGQNALLSDTVQCSRPPAVVDCGPGC
jgi:hypothetical protein